MATIMRVRTVFTGVAGAPYYSNHYFTDDSTSPTAQNAVDAVDNFWQGFDGNMTNQMSWTVEGTVARIDDVTGALVGQWGVTDATGVGGISGEVLPRIAQGLVRWLTGNVVSGRMLRGRTFIPGLLENMNTTGGIVLPTAVTLFQDQADELIADPDSQLLVWSRTHGVSHEVTGASAWNQWASLRSRRD